MDIDMGCLIFEKICSFIKNIGKIKRLYFPGLIGKILKSQGVPSRRTDSKPVKLKAMRFSSKLLKPVHGVNLDSDFEDEVELSDEENVEAAAGDADVSVNEGRPAARFSKKYSWKSAPKPTRTGVSKPSKKNAGKSSKKVVAMFDAASVKKQRDGLKAQLVSLHKMMKHISLQRQLVQNMLEALPEVEEDAVSTPAEDIAGPTRVTPTEDVAGPSGLTPAEKADAASHVEEVSEEVDESIQIDDEEPAVQAGGEVPVAAADSAREDSVFMYANEEKVDRTIEVERTVELDAADNAGGEVSSKPAQ